MAFNEKTVDGLRLVECHSSIAFIIKNIIAPMMPSVFVKQSKCKCQRKSKSEDLPFVPIGTISDIQRLSLMAQQFTMFKSESTCSECKATCRIDFELNDIIFFNTEELDSTAWEEIPKIIMLRGSIYVLAGVVQCIPPISSDFKSHFVSRVQRANRRWYVFDNSKKELYEQKGNIELIPHLLIFVLPKIIHGLSKILEKESNVSAKSIENDLIVLRNFLISSKDGKTTLVKNSCGPDSILQCLACCYKDSNKIRKIWNTNNSKQNTLMKLMVCLSSSSDCDEVHNMRNNLYRQHYNSTMVNSMETINCEGNIYEILKEIVTPILPSITTVFQCDCGKVMKTFPTIDLDLILLAEHGITHLQSAINQDFVYQNMRKKCRICVTDQIIKNVYGDIIFFNVEPLRSQTVTLGIADPVQLSDIPARINLFEQHYELKGVIDSIPGGIGHYVAHSIRNDSGWYLFNNLSPEVTKSPGTVRPHILIYFKK